jgi:hypothetical protein
MLRVEREHFWFMIVGLGVALFKLVSDGEFWRRRFVPYVLAGLTCPPESSPVEM